MRCLQIISFISVLFISSYSAAQTTASVENNNLESITKAEFAIVKDITTGEVLFAKNAGQQMFPSSMTKMMTTHVVFELIKEGRIKLTDKFKVSEKAWNIQGSKMFVELGNEISVDDLLHGVIIQSGNDACIVLAEGIAGSEEAFAVLMNEHAQKIGMKNSNFKNASGWPHEDHYTTAEDLAILAEHTIRDFPELYTYYAKTSFTYHGITQGNRNLLLYKNIGVDGLKTGHTDAAGYGITVSGKRGNRRLIVVVNGLKSEKERAEEATKLLEYGFTAFENYKLFSKGVIVGQADVWYGKKPSVPLVANDEIVATLPRADAANFVKNATAIIRYTSPVQAPVAAGAQVAELELQMPNQPLRKLPLYAVESVDSLGFFERIVRSLHVMAR